MVACVSFGSPSSLFFPIGFFHGFAVGVRGGGGGFCGSELRVIFYCLEIPRRYRNRNSLLFLAVLVDQSLPSLTLRSFPERPESSIGEPRLRQAGLSVRLRMIIEE